MLSLTLHLVVIFGTGIRGGSMRDARPNTKLAASSVHIDLIESHSSRPNPAATAMHQPVARPKKSPAKPSVVAGRADTALPVLFEVAVPQEPYYFKASELEEKPQVLNDVSPDLAGRLAGDLPQTGVLRLFINESGEVDQVIIDESNFSEENQPLVREAFAKMKFIAGKIAGAPVKNEMKIEITLENIVASPYAK